MGLLDRLFGPRGSREGESLYAATVARAREPHWYVEGAVPDTIDGRFEMIVALLSMVLIHLETQAVHSLSVRLTERFIADMDGQLRESGVGDVGIGKHVGQMMSMLGGRLGVYREGLDNGDLAPALIRNLYRGNDPGAAAVDHVSAALASFRAGLSTLSIEAVTGGTLP